MSTSSAAAPRTGLALALLAVTQFVLILDASIMNVALPSIQRGLDFPQDDLSWVSNAYTLAFGGFLLLGGRGADLFGPRRLFVFGLVLFTAASLLGGLAQTPVWLVAARAAQGLGAALVSPAALALLMITFPAGPGRNKALGVFAAMSGVGGAAGAILGGVLTEWIGWQAVLFVNVPVGIAAVLLAPALLPGLRATAQARSTDLAGAITVTLGLGLLVYVVINANTVGWTSANTLLLGALAIVLLAAFFVIESKSAEPLVPLRVFRQPVLRGANITAIALTAAAFPYFFFLTLYMQQVLGFSPMQSGLGQLPVAVALAVTANLTAKVVARIGFKNTLALGLVVIGAGQFWFAALRPPGDGGGFLIDVLGPSILTGVGSGLAFVGVIIAATALAPPEEAGLASGLINTTQQIGGAVGLAILVAVATSRTTAAVADGRTGPGEAVVEGFSLALLTAGGFALVGAVLALLLLKMPATPAAPAPAATADVADETQEGRTTR
ncbi:MFS transporter [Lentzea kentuckyensis]|jgi:EmrB/QacA subfamily drug resistance transporter|uniref:MFS transporter n=1 Tax=Lentzea kentuckyensis TaxID=360086 RepID=UPI000A37719E|nr:MFS transporter [Lentzea kentuckyensis]